MNERSLEELFSDSYDSSEITEDLINEYQQDSSKTNFEKYLHNSTSGVFNKSKSTSLTISDDFRRLSGELVNNGSIKKTDYIHSIILDYGFNHWLKYYGEHFEFMRNHGIDFGDDTAMKNLSSIRKNTFDFRNTMGIRNKLSNIPISNRLNNFLDIYTDMTGFDRETISTMIYLFGVIYAVKVGNLDTDISLESYFDDYMFVELAFFSYIEQMKIEFWRSMNEEKIVKGEYDRFLFMDMENYEWKKRFDVE